MDYLLLLGTTISLGAQFFLSGIYNKRVKSASPYPYSVIMALTVIIFFVITNNSPFSFNKTTILLGTLFGFCYAVTIVFQILALKKGTVALTSLVMSYSLIVPTVYIIITNNVTPQFSFYIGLILLAVALFLTNYNKAASSINKKQTLIWASLVTVAFFANGMCAVLQSYQQALQDMLFKSEFMIVAMIFVTAISSLLCFVNKRNSVESIKGGWHLAFFAGVFNAAANLFVLILVQSSIKTIIFPLISVGSIVIAYALSTTILKERLTKLQIIGLIVGLISIVFFNL